MGILAVLASLRRAAGAGRDGIAVRTRFRMAEEIANPFVELGADDVLEFAGLGVRLCIGDGKRVREQSFGEASAAHDVASASLARNSEIDFGIVNRDEAENR